MSACRVKMPKFRLKMDLSQLYEDERRLAYILIDSKWEKVQGLQDHVQNLFNVPEVHFVTDDDVYIPSQESIDVIKPNDTLRLIMSQKIKKRKKRGYEGSEEVGANGDANGDFIEESQSRCKLEVDDRLTSSTPNVHVSKKQKISLEDTVSDAIVTCGPGNDTVSSTNLNSIVHDPVATQSNEQLSVNEETVKTHKRKRVRKKARRDSSINKSSRLSQVPVPISSSTLRQSQSQSHLHFDDDQSNEERIVFRCRLAEQDELQAREIAEESPVRPHIEVQENIVIVKAMDNTSNDTSVIEIDDSVMAVDDIENLSYENIQSLTTPLAGYPAIGDKFLFRMIKPNGARPPEVSDYLCARCEDVNMSKMTVSCLLLTGSENFDGIRPGNGDEMAPNQNRVELRLDELVDKRCFRN